MSRRSFTTAVTVLIAMAAATALTSTALGSSKALSCGNASGPPHLSAQGIRAQGGPNCATARQVAKVFLTLTNCGLRIGKACMIEGFSCAEPKNASGLGSHPVVCRKRQASIDFEEVEG